MKRAAKRPSRNRRNGRKAKPSVAYDVVALVASAGGHAALETVLRALPPDFPAPLVVMQHLSLDVEEPLRPFGRRLPFSVQWAEPDASLARGRVLVAPPRTFLEILPDGTCEISPCQSGALARPIDRFLGSLARSFAHRAIGVVLSGMLDDGAEGACALRAAGGAVLAQTGAEYPSMPDAVVRSGGADVALPAEQIADLLGELATGAAMPRPMSELEAVERLFAGDGRARAAMRAVPWAATPLGSVLAWPQALSTAVRNAMSSTLPTCIYWGPELVQIYNEAFLPILGAKSSPAGKPARLTWPELWSMVGPRLESVLQTGSPVAAEDQLFQAERHGYPEELYVTYSLSALHDSGGAVRGVLGMLIDATVRVRASRRLKVLRDLGVIKSGESPLLVAEKAAKVLGDAPLDVPFALFYLFDQGRTRANLAACVGLNAGTAPAPHTIMLQDAKARWPLADVKKTGSPCTVNDLASRLPGAHTGPWPEAPSSATLSPLWSSGDERVVGAIVLGHSPRLRFDPTYEDFLRVIAQQVSASIAEAELRQRERERADQLAELDRVKVEFFSNVSHEFRTPLTLMLAPVEDMLRRRDALPSDLAGAVEAAARNGRRLLALVNTLLDFSQAESHREQARLEPTDLAALTLDIASAFRSAIETAGLRFDVQCDRSMPEVWVDRQMWEKIVSNLLSNALKFTFEGEITVELKSLSLHAELVVKDTGVGVPAHEIPNLAKRFHRVRGTRARTAEGSGIGLAMVHDFVRRMSGQLRVASKEGIGTTFTIWIPLKSLRVCAEPLSAEDGFRPTEFASQVAREASRWIADSDPAAAAPGDVLDDVFGLPDAPGVTGKDSPTARVLVVDDNADMRAYLERLLSPRWRVEIAADGARAFAAAVELLPDLILADVMMPGLDGFELLRKIRAHPGLRHTPVVLVTARTGEEAAIEGLMAGADDYIAKPFSPRELIARVGGQLELARARRRTFELNELLVRFSDAVRGLVDPHEVARTALRMVAEHFDAEEAYLAEVDWTTLEYVVEDVYLRVGGGDVPSLVGRIPHDAWEPRTSYYLANRSMVTDDALVDDQLSDALKAGFAARRIRAHISVPVAVDGQLRAVLGVNPGSSRRWTPEDVALVEGVAGRCWSEVERVRAEAAVRESEENYRVLFDTMGEGYGVIEVVRDATGRAVDLRYLEFNRAFERLSGMAREQLLGRQPGGGFLRADVERWLPVFAQVVQTGEPATFEQHLEGTDRWYEGSAYPRGGDRVSLFYRDITERKRAGAELLARNEELERFHDATVGAELRRIELKNGPRRRGGGGVSEPLHDALECEDVDDDDA